MIYVTHDQIEALTLADRIAVMKGGIIQQLGTPREIYDTPANLFVASFIGSPSMNFLEGRIALEGDVFHYRNAIFDVPLTAYPFARPPSHGQPVLLGVRPENIAVNVDPKPGQFGTEANVDLVEPTGADTVVWCQVGTHSISVRVDAAQIINERQKLCIGFDPGRASMFDLESGNRL